MDSPKFFAQTENFFCTVAAKCGFRYLSECIFRLRPQNIIFSVALSRIKTPLTPSDTRPIAHLPELSKILEKIVFIQFSNFLEVNQIPDSRQSGYRSGHPADCAPCYY